MVFSWEKTRYLAREKPWVFFASVCEVKLEKAVGELVKTTGRTYVGPKGLHSDFDRFWE